MKDYVGKRCWQAWGYASITVGTVKEQEMREKWLVLKVVWDNGSTTWEKAINLSFSLPKSAKDFLQLQYVFVFHNLMAM